MDSPIAVVIPYFQREPGILSRALQSIFGQRDVARRQRYWLTSEQSKPLKSKLRENREAFLHAAFGILLRGDKLDIASASRFVARNPMVIPELPLRARRELLAQAF